MARAGSSQVAPRPTLRLDDYLPYRLSVASNEVSRLVASAYERQFGVTIPQWRITAIIAEHGAQTPQQICRRSVMDKVTVSRASHALVERGFLERTKNGADGRSHLLTLTAAGLEFHAAIVPLALAFERALLDRWSEAEIDQLDQQLRRLQRTAATLAEFGGS